MAPLLQVLLLEAGAKVHVDLHQWHFPDTPKGVSFASLDHQDVSRSCFVIELVHSPSRPTSWVNTILS